MIKGYVSNIQDFSVNDGEGIRTTVFLSGCPLRCKWCSNPETLYEKGNLMSVNEVFSKIQRSMIFFQNSGGGVTFSGGEPTAQPEFLEALIDKCNSYGIHTAMESCGYFDYEKIKGILEKLDLLFFDIKHMDPVAHQEGTGVSNELILENLKKIGTMGKDIVIRVPLIHPYNDSDENIRQTVRFMKEYIPFPAIELLPYHFFGKEKYERMNREYLGEDFSLPTKERIAALKKIIRQENVMSVKY